MKSVASVAPVANAMNLAEFARDFGSSGEPRLAPGYASDGNGWALYCLVLADAMDRARIGAVLRGLSGTVFPSPSSVEINKVVAETDEGWMSADILSVVSRVDDPGLVLLLASAFQPDLVEAAHPSVLGLFLARKGSMAHVR